MNALSAAKLVRSYRELLALNPTGLTRQLLQPPWPTALGQPFPDEAPAPWAEAIAEGSCKAPEARPRHPES